MIPFRTRSRNTMTRALHDIGSVFGNRNFRNLWFAQVISQTALNMLVFVLGVVVYEASRSNTAVSIVYLMFSLPATIFGVISGILVDRVEKKRVLIISTILRIPLVFIMLLFLRELPIVYVLLVLISIISQLFVPAEATLIPQYVGEKHLVAANTLFTLTFYTAVLSGFVIAGPLYGYLGSELMLLLLTVLFIISTLFLFVIPSEKQKHVDKLVERSVVHDIREMVNFMRKNIYVGSAVILMTTMQTVIAIMATLAPGFADRILARAVSDASLIILGPAAIGMIAGAFITPQLSRRYRKKLLIEYSLLISGILLSCIALIIFLSGNSEVTTWFVRVTSIKLSTTILPIAISAFFFLGVVNSVIDVLCNHTLQSQTPERLRGKIYGVLASLVGGVAILPVVISGIFADIFGVTTIIGVLGILLIIFTYIGRSRFSRVSTG